MRLTFRYHFLWLAFSVSTIGLFAQVDSGQIILPFPFQDESLSPVSDPKEGGFYMNTPSNITTDVQYDPKTKRYVFDQKIGEDIPYRRPAAMSLDEYLEYDMQKSLQKFWSEKASESDPDSEEGGDASKSKPLLKVENETLDRIFGEGGIEIKPQGSAEIILGAQRSATRNPAIPLNQQAITTMLFDQKIQLSVLGQLGDKMKINMNFNTEAMFNFENMTKLSYTGKEDEIIQLLEAGNVSMPLKTSLITGSQTLMGIKTGLKFGKLKVTTILSQQNGKKQEIEIKNGAQIKEFEVKADDYEYNQHFFLDHFFRDQYEKSVATPPILNSEIYITKIEVYKTPLNVFENTRNIIAFQDLGTADPSHIFNSLLVTDQGASMVADNKANSLYPMVSQNPSIRGFVTAVNALKTMGFQDRKDFFTIGQSQMLLEGKDYILNRQLGYISLNSEIPADFALAVAFQFTYRGKTYQVGEFSTDGYTGTDPLILKMIKSVELDVKAPMWDLMMKNIYNLGNAYQVKKEGFQLDIWYLDQTTGVKVNYLPSGSLKNKSLIQVLGWDKLSVNNQPIPGGDGVFDFLDNPTISIIPQTGKVIFPVLEPFGEGLKKAFPSGEESIGKQYAFDSLYTNTQPIAMVNFPQKNRFYIKGRYESSVSSEIALGSFNIPQGSVQVTQGGNVLTENMHYTVDYNLGRVKIIDAGVLQSATPIKISLESNTMFSIVQRSLMGARFDYDFNRNLTLGGTLLRMSERPVTQKVMIGDEPFINTMLGLDATYNKESKLVSDLINRIPLIESKGKAKFNFSGEFAKLFPGHPDVIGETGNAYIDDFEGSQSTIELRGLQNWKLASTPQGQNGLFPEAKLGSNIANGFGRARLSWYTVDPSVFYGTGANKPDYLTKDNPILSNHFMRQVLENEVFPNRDVAQTSPQNIAMFDLAFYPNERGPYNYDVDGKDTLGVQYTSGANPDGTLVDPETRWAGIMRDINTNDFDAANVEFIQFWLMDPFAEEGTAGYPDATNRGELFFNIGNVSEDVLRDDQIFFENGLGTSEQDATDLSADTLSAFGRVIPNTIPYLLNAFDNDPQKLKYQDVGLDGLRNQEEARFFETTYLQKLESYFGTGSQAYQKALADPSTDDYNYFLDDDYDAAKADILTRYKMYNGMEGNSPTSDQYASQNAAGYPTTATTLPNTEDINLDKTLNYGEGYYQYRVKITKNDINESNVGKNYIYSMYYDDDYKALDGTSKPVRWYQFRIPVRDINREAIGGIQNLNSIRFMRIFMKGFKDPVFLRFARLELVRGEWRKFLGNNKTPGEYIEDDKFNTFNVSAVNIEENSYVDVAQNPTGVNYVLPPTINRVINLNTINNQRLNEQALVLQSCGLPDGHFNAAYRNVNYDVRMYKRLQMFVHGHSFDKDALISDDQVKVFVRIGSDFENNYYEYEMPLKITPPGNYNGNDDNARKTVWPEANNIDIEFAQLTKAKTLRNASILNNYLLLQKPYTIEDPNYPGRMITVVGNPNLSTLKSVMIGIKNPKDDGREVCLQVWVNELRLNDFNNDGGWAALGRLVSELPGLGTLSMAGNISTPGFGSIDKRVAERQLYTAQGVDLSFSTDLGQFVPALKLKVPTYFGYSQNVIKPRFNPLDPDVELASLLEGASDANKNYIDSLMESAKDLTISRSFNVTNVRKEKGKSSLNLPFNLSNFTVSYAYQEIYKRNINLSLDLTKKYNGNLTYGYSLNVKPLEPFKWIKSKSKYLSLIKDFNIGYAPKSIGFSTDLERLYNERVTRNTNPGIRAELPPFYNKTFNWKRMYDLKWDLSKSLKFDFTATNLGLIGEPYGKVDKKTAQEQYKLWRDSVYKSMSQGGITLDYRHQMGLNWAVPLSKLPLLDWITLTAGYTGSYNWTRAPFAADTLGHTIQNSNSFQLNGNVNFLNLYNKVPYLKKVNQKFNKPKVDKKAAAKKSALEKKVNKVIDEISDSTKVKDPKKEKTKKDKEDEITILDHVAKVLMGVKNASITYNLDNGLLLPGYAGKTRMLGMSNDFASPSIPFIMGIHQYVGDAKDVPFAPYAAQRGWLVQGVNITTMHTTTKNEQINLRSSIEPIKDFRVDLTANSSYGFNTSQFYNWNDSLPGGPGYQSQSYMETGNFSRSFNAYSTAFAKIDSQYNSDINREFLINRAIISERLSNDRAGNVSTYLQGLHPNDTGYQAGYGQAMQDVLIPSFLAAYSGKDPGKVKLNPIRELPNLNWRVTYTGLNRLKIIKDHVKTLSISHGYKSTLTLSSFTSNILFFDTKQTSSNGTEFTDSTDANANFIPRFQINSVVISEQLSPLISIDMTLKNNVQAKFEIKKDRTITLSIPNTQVTELNGIEYIIGSGYVIPKVKFPFKLPGSSKKIESNLTLRADFSIRDNKTILRKIVEGTNVASAGQKIYSLKSSADYKLTEKLNLRYFLDWMSTTPFVSNSFPTSNMSTGLSVRFTL